MIQWLRSRWLRIDAPKRRWSATRGELDRELERLRENTDDLAKNGPFIDEDLAQEMLECLRDRTA